MNIVDPRGLDGQLHFIVHTGDFISFLYIHIYYINNYLYF